jgi:hypothetical protein
MTTVNASGQGVEITSSVATHNWFGNLYMVPAGPAHRLIVWAMLRRLKNMAVS